jgi:hypothetical protein
MVVTRADSTGMVRDTSFAVTSSFLHVLFSKIEYRDALKAGTVSVNQTSSPFLNPQIPPGDLPFGTGPSLFNEFPRIGFSVGISTFEPEFSGLDDVVQSILEGYRAQGYDLQSPTKPTSLSMPLLAPVFGLSGAFTPEWQVEILTSVPTGGEMGLWYASLTGTYTPEFLTGPTVRLGLSSGIIRIAHEFSTAYTFGTSSRISPLDSVGRYQYLNFIAVAGSGVQWGGMVSLLGEYHSNRFSLISAYVQYTFGPTYHSEMSLGSPPSGLPIDQSGLGQYEFRITGISIGAKLTIHF